ncbi:MAG: FtsX-like permease family protein [Acidobacteriaceae bacterium]|nr:FtsX-like permease family protein [Acidobacteriaceae bacterium]
MFLSTASKIAFRELRATPGKFLFVVVAVAIGIAALTGVKGFGAAFKGMLLTNAKQLIAGDLQGQFWALPTPQQEQQMSALGREYGQLTRVTETVSMAGSSHQRIPQMIAVKAIDPAVYPYYGHLATKPAESLRSLLCDDASVVATPELLLRLKVKPGDIIRIGGKEFRITGTLITEPDRLASGFGPGMRVLMTRGGLDRTGLIQFGSRAAQRFLFKLNPQIDLDRLKARMKVILPHVFISDYREGSPVVGKAIDNTTTFLSLVSLIALIVGSLGVAMAMYSHLQQRMDTIGIMKALGARANQVIYIYLLQTLCLGVAGALVGIGVGAAVQRSFPWLIRRVSDQLPPVPWDWSFSIQGMCLGMLATVLFTLPPLLGIRNIKPNLVFRRDMADAVTQNRRRWRDKVPQVFAIVVIIAGFAGIAVWLSDSLQIGSYFIGGLATSLLVLGAIAVLLLLVMRRLVRSAGFRLPAVFRHGFANLYRPGNHAGAVLVALGVGVMFTLTTYLLQRTVLNEVVSEGPGREGNIFLLDIHNATGVRKLVESEPGVNSRLELAGYIVARLVTKNGLTPDRLDLSRERKDRLGAVRITTAEGLPDGLDLIAGHWWSAASNTPEMAVSEEVRRDFHLRIGDRIEFQIAGRTVFAPIVAEFKREARAPVRYDLVMPTQALIGFPVVYYGAVHAQPAQIPQIEEDLFDRFPTVTVMNLADVLRRIQEAVDQVAVVVRFLAFFAIAAGIIILCSSVAGTRYRRIREVAILKTVGATKGRIASIFSVEFSVLGAVAGFIGAVLANVFTKIIAHKFIETTVSFDWVSLLIAAACTVLLANAAGWLASARILNEKPLAVLRNE